MFFFSDKEIKSKISDLKGKDFKIVDSKIIKILSKSISLVKDKKEIGKSLWVSNLFFVIRVVDLKIRFS